MKTMLAALTAFALLAGSPATGAGILPRCTAGATGWCLRGDLPTYRQDCSTAALLRSLRDTPDFLPLGRHQVVRRGLVWVQLGNGERRLFRCTSDGWLSSPSSTL